MLEGKSSPKYIFKTIFVSDNVDTEITETINILFYRMYTLILLINIIYCNVLLR